MIGRKGVRSIVSTWFTGTVAGLNTVYTGEPRNIPDGAYFAGAPGTKSGTIGFSYIEGQKDRRIAFTGNPVSGGQARLIIYEVAFALRFLSYQAKGETALDDHDNIIDLFSTRLRSDRTMGGQLWQVGDGDTVLGEDIHIISGPGPKVRKQGGPIIIWSMARFIAIESL